MASLLSLHDPWFSYGFVGVRKWLPAALVAKLDAAASRPGSKARHLATVISGGVTQIDMAFFNAAERKHADLTVDLLLDSLWVRRAADELWGAGVKVRCCARMVLEGGSEQIPHADALYPNALVAVISLRDGTPPSLMHVDPHSHRTSFSRVRPVPAPAEDAPLGVRRRAAKLADAAEALALDSISVVARPTELNMRPALDSNLAAGDGVLMATSVVHAGPGGAVLPDGAPRRVAFISIEPCESYALTTAGSALATYDSRYQWHALQFLHHSHRDDEEAFFSAVQQQAHLWHARGHDLTHFFIPAVHATFVRWLSSRGLECPKDGGSTASRGVKRARAAQ